MRRKRPFTEPDRIKERIQAVSNRIIFKEREKIIANHEIENNRQRFAAQKIMTEIALNTRCEAL